MVKRNDLKYWLNIMAKLWLSLLMKFSALKEKHVFLTSLCD